MLHDAWNLAYAGDLSFATAFNMTLFMKFERDHLVWNPVFTFIDHIGRHIDMSNVHKKFEVKFSIFTSLQFLFISSYFDCTFEFVDLCSNSIDASLRRTWSSCSRA